MAEVRIGARSAVLVALLMLATPAVSRADISGTEGEQFSGAVGTFSDPCPTDPEPPHVHLCSDLRPTATINWGDGLSTGGTVARQPVQTNQGPKPCTGNYPSCTFSVSGSHTYPGANNYAGSVSWSDPTDGSHTNSGSFNFTAHMGDAPISLSNVSISRSGQNVTMNGTLTDTNPDGQACDFTVSINWGDGQTTNGSVVGANCTIFSRRHGAASDATFSITGSHSYTSEPSGNAVVTVSDYGGASDHTSAEVPSLPRTTTEGATSVTQSGATLNGFVDPQGGQLQNCHFDWGTSPSYGHTAPCSPATFSTPQAVSANLTGLAPGTTYHYRVVASTSVDTVMGADMSFQTLQPVAPGAPIVSTGGATSIAGSSATLNGIVNPTGHTVANCHFEWGTTTNYGHTANCFPSSLSGSSGISVTAKLNGLSPDTTYHFRLVASNAGIPASQGADSSFLTLPTCSVEPTFGYVDAKGCFAHTGNVYTSTPGTTVNLNGLTLTPDTNTTSIIIDPADSEVYALGRVSVSAGSVPLDDEKFRWTEPAPGGALAVKIASLNPPNGAKVGGLPLEGNVSLSFNKTKGTDITGNAQLPFGTVASLLGINGTVELHTTVASGLLQDQLKIKKDKLQVFGVGIKNLMVVYSPADDRWEGGAEVSLPTPNQLDIAADLAFQHGKFHKFSGAVDNINFPIVDGVYLQRISVVFGVDPTTIGGGLGLSFGPQVDGKSLVRVDGDFIYQAATGQAAGFIQVDGSLTLASFKIANAYFDYFTNGMIRFGGHFQIGLPDSNSSEPAKQPVYIDSGLDGAVFGSQFDIDDNVTVALNFIDLTIGAEVLVSDKGIVACAKLSAFGFTWSPGVGYTWATHAFDLMSHGCSVGPWKTLELGAGASAVPTATKFNLAKGHSLLEIKGTTAQPWVTLTGPGGKHVSVPTTSVAPFMVPGFMVLQDTADKITYIAVQHGGGTWHVTLEPGSSPIASIRGAGMLPTPSVSGRVTGTGRHRILTWRLRKIPGQKVVFWEKGADVSKIIGRSSAARGSIKFTPADGRGGRRAIEAQVISYGLPRTGIVIAHYKAPPAARPGKPGHLKATAARGGAVHVTWNKAAFAQTYIVELDTKDGAHLVEFAGAKTHSLVVHNVVPITAATVKVTGELISGAHGPTAQVKYKAPKPKPKRNHK